MSVSEVCLGHSGGEGIVAGVIFISKRTDIFIFFPEDKRIFMTCRREISVSFLTRWFSNTCASDYSGLVGRRPHGWSEMIEYI